MAGTTRRRGRGGAASADQERRDRPGRVDDPLEKLALGRTPADEVALASPRRLPWSPPGIEPTARLDVVRGFLAAHDELREELAAAVEAAWERTGHDRTAYLREVAELRAQLLSRAELHAVREQAGQVTDDLLEGLAAYLDATGPRAAF
jgi:hypothetical protein